MFRSIADAGAALEFTGAFHHSQYIRPSVPAIIQRWQDFSMGAGIPAYNAYVGIPLEFTPLLGSRNRSIYAGEPTVTGEDKKLFQIQFNVLSATTPASFILCDYLGFYPLIDYGSSDLQEMDNTLPLSRYSNGVGVQMMLVNSVATTINSAITITYIDSNDVTRTVTVNTNTAQTGLIQGVFGALGGQGIPPFLPLQSNCPGVKKVISVQSDGAGDGLGNLVLVKPLTGVSVPESNIICEVNFINDKMIFPKIENQAFLNFIGIGSASATMVVRAELLFIRG